MLSEIILSILIVIVGFIAFKLNKSNKVLSEKSLKLEQDLLKMPQIQEENDKLKAEQERTKDYDVKLNEIQNLNTKLNEQKDNYETLKKEKDEVCKRLEEDKKQALADLTKEKNEVIQNQENDLKELRDKAGKLEGANSTIEQLNKQIIGKDKDIEDLKQQSRIDQEKYVKLSNDYNILETNAYKDKEVANQKKEELEKQNKELVENLKTDFENLAKNILEKQSKTFDEGSSKSIELALKPLKERLESYNKSLDDFKLENSHQLKTLLEANTQISTGATELANALRGNSKVQGDWGESIVENLLNAVGLQKDVTYFEQKSFENTDETVKRENLRPDFIVKISEEKYIIIDSKVSLTDHTRYVNAKTEDERKEALKKHIGSIESHIDELAKYMNIQVDNMKFPDFVIMCIPNESAYYDAISEKPILLQNALQKRVSILTPTSLVPALKIIRQFWKLEKQYKNLDEIKSVFEETFKRLQLFIDRYEGLKESVKTINTKMEDIDKSITGNQGLMKSYDKLSGYNLEKNVLTNNNKKGGRKSKKNDDANLTLSIEDQREVFVEDQQEDSVENDAPIDVSFEEKSES